MVILGAVKTLQRRDLRDNSPVEYLCCIQLSDVGEGDTLLVFIGVKNGRAIGRANVGSLPVKLGEIMSYGKKDPQQLAVGDPRGVIDHLDGFRMFRGLGNHLIVSGSLRGAAG